MRGKFLVFLAPALLAVWAGLIDTPPLGMASRGEVLVEVHEDFRQDPGWEGVNNRIECVDCPTVTQDFGWRPTSHSGGGKGEIGGRIWRSRTPAYYAMPLGRPLTFEDAFSASGRIVFRHITAGRLEGQAGAAYIGFFNSTRQGWRPWSSVAIRLLGEAEDRVGVHVDYMTAKWGGYGDELDTRLSGIGIPHTWRMSYAPEARMSSWPDPRLKNYLSSERQTAEEIFEKAKKAEPDATLEGVRRRLGEALEEGLVRFFERPSGAFWTLNLDYGPFKGAVTVQFDGGRPHRFYLLPEHRAGPLLLDRFGIFNFQVYHSSLEFYLSDLTVNGQKIDLSRDPGWEGKGNRTQFVERDFHRQDFGYSQTNWAGERVGEIGGLFYRTEAVDPLHGYYADRIGKLRLDDRISFAGSVCFPEGGTDAGMYIGYFNAAARMVQTSDKYGAEFGNDSMGIVIGGPTRVGYYFSAYCSPKRGLAAVTRGPVFLPTAERRRFRFDYNPQANRGMGRITIALDGEATVMDLTAEQRAAGAVFDRFGLMNIRRGGKYVRIYFDDLMYTARRSRKDSRVRHEQTVVTVPYPPGGRKY